MDNLEHQPDQTEPTLAAPPSLEDIQAQCHALRWLQASLLVLLIVLTLAFDFYVRHHTQTIEAEFAMIVQRRPFINQYVKQAVPRNNEFVTKLVDFSRSHPDFLPILTRYGVHPAPVPPTAPTPGPASQPAAPPQQKK